MPSPIATPPHLLDAAQYLAAHDPILGNVIAGTEPCTIEAHTAYYQALGDSIIGQQLSVKAAATIKHRFRELFDGSFPTPEAILAKPLEILRTAGLSQAKATYIRDLAMHVQQGSLDFASFDNLDNEKIIATLVAIKGIGEWTAHMFLLFCMGRLDVLPTGDLGIRSGIRKLYDLNDLPTPETVQKIAREHHWHPYESVASWYIWRSLDNAPTD